MPCLDELGAAWIGAELRQPSKHLRLFGVLGFGGVSSSCSTSWGAAQDGGLPLQHPSSCRSSQEGPPRKHLHELVSL